MKSVFENINETGKVFGIPILQPKAVQTEFDSWLKENHPYFGVFQFIISLITAIGIVGWYTNVHPTAPLVTLIPFAAYLGVVKILGKQYDKQAPEELKRK